jgi:dihydroorotase
MTRYLALILLLSPAASGQQVYDILLKNGHVIDPANRRDGRFDVAVTGAKIARVAQDLPAAHARVVIDASAYYVTPGLIDINTHFDTLPADHNALPSGVTTAVSSTGKNFEEFKIKVIDRSKTRLLAFLRISGGDDPEAAARTIRQYPNILVGVTSADAVDRAIKAAELSNTVVMGDIGAKGVRRGDIVTHMYGLGTPRLDVDKRKRGVLFDAGSFWFRIAAPAVKQGFLPDTISTDIDNDNVMLPRANMITTMSKFLNLGMTLDQIIERTTVNPARAIRRPDIGALSEGAIADIAVIEMQKGNFGFLDSGHARLIGDRRLRCVLTVRNGDIVWDSDGLSAPDWIKAGPYSNFK